MKDTKKVKKKRRIGLRIFIVILVLLVIAGGIFAYKMHKNGGGLEGFLVTTLGNDEKTVENLKPIYCVLLGQSQNLTDTIMLAAYNPKTQEASLLSIQRDTFVGKDKNKARPEHKINALCQYTHPERTVEAVSKLTGIDVTNYILIDTKALVKVVDLLGGVWFDVPIDMKYVDTTQNLNIDLKKGSQLLNGINAEGLVRFRHNSDGSTYPSDYGMEDIGRTRTQREFLTEVAKQTLKPQNVLKLGGFLDIFYENVKTNLEMSQIKDYIPYMVNFNTENLKTNILPGKSVMSNGVSIYLANATEGKQVVQELFGSLDDTVDATTIAKVEILNGTGSETKAEELKTILTEKGYEVIGITKTTTTSKTSIVNRMEKEDSANIIKKIIEVGNVSKGTKTGDADITIVLGKDYE